MKKQPVHHIHVKYRDEIFTIYHNSDVVLMSDLIHMITNILKEISDDTQR